MRNCKECKYYRIDDEYWDYCYHEDADNIEFMNDKTCPYYMRE